MRRTASRSCANRAFPNSVQCHFSRSPRRDVVPARLKHGASDCIDFDDARSCQFHSAVIRQAARAARSDPNPSHTLGFRITWRFFAPWGPYGSTGLFFWGGQNPRPKKTPLVAGYLSPACVWRSLIIFIRPTRYPTWLIRLFQIHALLESASLLPSRRISPGLLLYKQHACQRVLGGLPYDML